MKTLEIYRDDDAVNPRRDFDTIGALYIPASNRYLSGDAGAYQPDSDFKGVILPVYAYIHGSITIRAGSPFSCLFDSGQIGVTYITRDRMIRDNLDDDMAVKLLTAEIETYNQWLNGDVYGFILRDSDGTEIDSCWGFYGADPEKNGMLDYVSLVNGDVIRWMAEYRQTVTKYKPEKQKIIGG